MRRAGHEGLSQSASADFYAPQSREAILLVDGLLKHPELWNEEIRRRVFLHLRISSREISMYYFSSATASMIWSVIYDKPPITSTQDPQIARINDFITRIVRAAFPGAHYVEFFTWMKYIPSSIAKWKREAEEWYRKDSELFEGFFLEARQRVVSDLPFSVLLCKYAQRFSFLIIPYLPRQAGKSDPASPLILFAIAKDTVSVIKSLLG